MLKKSLYSLCLIAAFGYGVSVGNYKIFPFWGIYSIKETLVRYSNTPVVAKDNLSKNNIGLYKELTKEINPINDNVTLEDIRRIFGVHERLDGVPIKHKIITDGKKDDLDYQEGYFNAWDGVEVPYYEIFPPGFEPDNSYPTIILYSGHGNMDQIAFDKRSYQKGLGIQLAKQGFLIFVMENRGMGRLSHLGDHMRLDAVARLRGGSWYGDITTDALYLLQMVVERRYTDSDRIGVGGVSTGGALSLLTSALDDRVKATYVQGYLV